MGRIVSRPDERKAWCRLGKSVELVFGERITERDRAGYPCLYCGAAIPLGGWWWHIPGAWLPAGADWSFQYGYCSSCVQLFRIRARDVPRGQWLEEVREFADGYVYIRHDGVEYRRDRHWLADLLADLGNRP